MMLDAGADVDVVNSVGRTAAQMAAFVGEPPAWLSPQMLVSKYGAPPVLILLDPGGRCIHPGTISMQLDVLCNVALYRIKRWQIPTSINKVIWFVSR